MCENWIKISTWDHSTLSDYVYIHIGDSTLLVACFERGYNQFEKLVGFHTSGLGVVLPSVESKY